jgi:1,4-dihydroxy-2-naphthoate octaprenyltransferase
VVAVNTDRDIDNRGAADSTAVMRTLFATFRLPFLVLTLACVFLGVSTAVASGAEISLVNVGLVLAGALAAHISVNSLNEYLDFRSGLDARTEKTPFSGGSGALVHDPSSARAVLLAGLAGLALVIVLGIYFLWLRGPAILPVGLGGILLILTYTQWLNRYPLLCLLAPGTGFGLFMVAGTHYALVGQFSAVLQWAVWVPFFLVNNLLLLNQFPDLEADASIGRRHVPIAYGLKFGAACYAAFVAATLLVLAGGIRTAVFPALAAIAFIPMLAAMVALVGAIRFARSDQPEVKSLLPFMALNVAAANLTPVLLGVSLWLG